MVVSSVMLTNGSGLFRLAQRSYGIQRLNSLMFSRDLNRVSFSRFHESQPQEPLWLSLSRDFVWSTRSLFSFMVEQPKQLKFIEWPSFTTTLKTATLSLFLVAVFIVALSSVDSTLCYVLAMLLRRKAP